MPCNRPIPDALEYNMGYRKDLISDAPMPASMLPGVVPIA